MGNESVSELIERYNTGAELLVYATQQLNREQEQARPGPGRWSIAELVTHLLDSDLVYADRVKRIIAEDEPTLQGFDESAWNERLGGHERPVEPAVNLFVANRHWMSGLLRRLRPEDFQRVGHHTEVGRQSLAQIVVAVTGHLDHHLRFLYGKRGNLGVALYPRYSNSPHE